MCLEGHSRGAGAGAVLSIADDSMTQQPSSAGLSPETCWKNDWTRKLSTEGGIPSPEFSRMAESGRLCLCCSTFPLCRHLPRQAASIGPVRPGTLIDFGPRLSC